MRTTWLKLSHHEHSGRLRPHEYTSYLPLAVLLLVVGVALAISSVYAASPGPASSSVGLSGTMPGPAPTVAAKISTPSESQTFSTSPITISGSCPATTLVEIFKNDIFAGSTPCSDSGNFSLQVDLLLGKNKLVARVYDVLNQPGPDSNTVTVYYNALPSQAAPLSALNFDGTQLLLNTDAVYRGVFPQEQLNVPVDIIGGTAPYAVNVQWGDSSNKIVARSNNLTFSVAHTYSKPGTYQITLQATDAHARVAFLTVAAIVNGQTTATASSTNTPKTMNKLLVLWPLYTTAVAMVVSFWLGERREKRMLASMAPVYIHKS